MAALRLARPFSAATVLTLTIILGACTSSSPSVGSSSTASKRGTTSRATGSSGPDAGDFGLHVSGANLVDNQTGQVVQLRGINQMAAGRCTGRIDPPGIVFGPTDPSSLAVLAAWHVNTVRVTANEDCWLGINGAPPQFAGANYRGALISYVDMLTANHYYVVFDLHVNAPGANLSVAQQPMADADHAPAYWTSVADTFESNPAVIFEPYNEPDITTADANTTDPWACWLDGCEATAYDLRSGPHKQVVAENWGTVGMQALVNTIRATGANNVITLSGLHFAADLSGLLAHLPVDPDHNLAATFHNYGSSLTMAPCDLSCWNTTIAPVATQMPVITDEMGEPDCQTSYVTTYLDWADSHGVSYLPWGWTPDGCANRGYGLLANWTGTPNSYGLVFYDHFASRAKLLTR